MKRDLFKEQLIFEEYKDRYLWSANKFKNEIKTKYGIKVSSDLYKKLINYQINKYGSQITDCCKIDYINKEQNRNHDRRQRDLKNNQDSYELEKFMKRNGY